MTPIYSIRQEVTALNPAKHEWEPGVITEVDAHDDRLPYRVRFADEGTPWVGPLDIRPLGPVGQRLQYRTHYGNTGRGARYGDWVTLEPGMRVSVDGARGIETRVQPFRTDAEIVAALRTYTDEQRANGIICDEKFANILGGTF